MSDLIYILQQLCQIVWLTIALLFGIIVLGSGGLFLIGTILISREKRKNQERIPQPW